MFKSLKQLIDSRLGQNIAIHDVMVDGIYFIKLKSTHLLRAANFLKHDPDTSLALFHQMLVIPIGLIPWPEFTSAKENSFEIIYQLKSLKLSYEVSLAVEKDELDEQIPSIADIYLGARFFEKDISSKTGLNFESSERDFLSKKGIVLW
jgi:NADH:ubiquinone oxidoreductase subunit C